MFTPSSSLALFLSTCALFSSAPALPVLSPVMRDVWIPQITSPQSGMVWSAGSTYTVTWDASSPPPEITNPNGEVYLRRGGATQASPIAEGFPLSAGQVDVTIPSDTVPADDWIVVLFGDSGNWSPSFTITAPVS